MLPEIVEAVGDKLTVLFDSGIRTGVDIIKALSLGAKGVLLGRPPIYGLAVGGKVRSPCRHHQSEISNFLCSKERNKCCRASWPIWTKAWDWQVS